MSHDGFVLDDLVPLEHATKLLPGSVHKSTLFRWQSRGVRGVRLATVRIGGRRYVSRDALERFAIESTAAASGDHIAIPMSRSSRSRSVDSAERELDARLTSAGGRNSRSPKAGGGKPKSTDRAANKSRRARP